jgi:hypothetical protein
VSGRVLLTEKQLAEMPEVAAWLAGDYERAIGLYHGRLAEQAPTTSLEIETREERIAEIDQEMRGDCELSELEILQGLADDGVLAAGSEGSVDARILSDLAQQQHEGEAGRRPFAHRNRLKPERHGTLYRYVHGKCRCPECRGAMAAWKRERRRKANV